MHTPRYPLVKGQTKLFAKNWTPLYKGGLEHRDRSEICTLLAFFGIRPNNLAQIEEYATNVWY